MLGETAERVNALELGALKRTFDGKNATIESLSQEVVTLREQVQALSTAFSELVAKYDRLSARMTNALTDFSELQSSISEAFNDVRTVQQSESDSLNAMLTSLHKVFDARAETLGSIGSDGLMGAVIATVSKHIDPEAASTIASVQTAVNDVVSDTKEVAGKIESAVESLGNVVGLGANILSGLMSPRQRLEPQ